MGESPKTVKMIPDNFKYYWSRKRGMAMSLEECWQKWQDYWHLRQKGPNDLNAGDQYVLGRYGDQGLYTVENCRVITHRENTRERDHNKCRDKLLGRVHNPEGLTGKSRRVCTPQGEFENCTEAARAYGLHRSSMWHRVQSPLWEEFYWKS